MRVGDLLGGRYEVLRLIGRGAMGVVVEARHVGHGERVAVKILHERYRSHDEALGRFAQEGRAAARIRGEHSVRLHDTGEHDGCPFLVMELLVGQDLAMVLEDGPLPVAEAAAYLLQACEGMAEVHAHGMVHRDLKPSNLFVTERPDGTPLLKVLDFGIAKGVRADDEAALVQTQTFVAMGTPLYMSPEQIRSSSSVDARADVWSLGTIFYELVAGRPAFGGNTVTNITAQVLERDPPALTTLVAGLPPAVDEVIARALHKSPERRFVDVAALAAALEPLAPPTSAGAAARCARILQGALRPDIGTTPPVSHDDGLGGTMRFDPRRRTRWVRAAIGALAIAAVAMVAMAATAYTRGSPASGRVLARQGLGVLIQRRVDELPPLRGSSAAAPSGASAAPPEASPSPSATHGGSSVAVRTSPSAPRTKLEPAPLAPSSQAGKAAAPSATSPAPPPPPPPADRPYNPFSERN